MKVLSKLFSKEVWSLIMKILSKLFTKDVWISVAITHLVYFMTLVVFALYFESSMLFNTDSASAVSLVVLFASSLVIAMIAQVFAMFTTTFAILVSMRINYDRYKKAGLPFLPFFCGYIILLVGSYCAIIGILTVL